jgi:hypothetical protein
VSEGEAAHLGWVMAHPARARRRVRAARDFISPKAAGALICNLGGGREGQDSGDIDTTLPPFPFWRVSLRR